MNIKLIPVIENYKNDFGIEPYRKELPFYPIHNIPHEHLHRLLKDKIDLLDEHEALADENGVDISFYGGYILNIDGYDKFYPQCCSSLSDILFWKNLSNQGDTFIEGHPKPIISYKNETIIFEIKNDNSEDFYPPMENQKIFIDIEDLKQAIHHVVIELQAFERKLEWLNEKYNYRIKNIGDKLIWHNFNSTTSI